MAEFAENQIDTQVLPLLPLTTGVVLPQMVVTLALETDESQQVAKSYGAACTPDFYLFDRDGRLVYRGEPLAQVVADLNAQFRKPIRIVDPALAAEPISGVLVLDDETAVVRRLALLVSAHAVPSDGGVILQRNETPPKR